MNLAQVVRRRHCVSLSSALRPLSELHSTDFCFGCAWRRLIYSSCLCSSQNLCASYALSERAALSAGLVVQNSASFEHIHGFAAHEFCIPVHGESCVLLGLDVGLLLHIIVHHLVFLLRLTFCVAPAVWRGTESTLSGTANT